MRKKLLKIFLKLKKLISRKKNKNDDNHKDYTGNPFSWLYYA